MTIGEVLKVNKDSLDVASKAVLANGDGLNVLVKRDIVGFRANKIEKIANERYRIYPNEMPMELFKLRPNHPLNRNLDHQWQQSLTKSSSERRIGVHFQLTSDKLGLCLHATSEEGVAVSQRLDGEFSLAHQPDKTINNYHMSLEKLGQTDYFALTIKIELSAVYFVPNAAFNQLRRDVIEALTMARLAAYPRAKRRPIAEPAPIYPATQLTYLDNVYNHKAREFYQRFGVTMIEAAYEAHQVKDEAPVMITKHCLRFAFNLCPKQAKGVTGVKTKATPMQLVHNDEILTLKFNCRACEMQVWGKIKSHILKSPLAGSQLILLNRDD